MALSCFVTVGSTLFDDLIDAVLDPKTAESFKKLNITKIVIQYGAGSVIQNHVPGDAKTKESGSFETKDGIQVEYYRYKKSILQDMAAADLIIGHGGSGTALDTLKLKKPMIAVINDKLMDNHQTELADRLAELGHLTKTTTSELHSSLLQPKVFSPVPFVQTNPHLFGEYITTKLGYTV